MNYLIDSHDYVQPGQEGSALAQTGRRDEDCRADVDIRWLPVAQDDAPLLLGVLRPCDCDRCLAAIADLRVFVDGH